MLPSSISTRDKIPPAASLDENDNVAAFRSASLFVVLQFVLNACDHHWVQLCGWFTSAARLSCYGHCRNSQSGQIVQTGYFNALLTYCQCTDKVFMDLVIGGALFPTEPICRSILFPPQKKNSFALVLCLFLESDLIAWRWDDRLFHLHLFGSDIRSSTERNFF